MGYHLRIMTRENVLITTVEHPIVFGPHFLLLRLSLSSVFITVFVTRQSSSRRIFDFLRIVTLLEFDFWCARKSHTCCISFQVILAEVKYLLILLNVERSGIASKCLLSKVLEFGI